MELEFEGVVVFWRGPAPWHFVSVPGEQAGAIASVAAHVTYGWGMIPATVTLGASTWTTSLWPKDGGFLVPIKTAVRRAEDVEVDSVVRLRLVIAS
ncbi:DUF1905 domain-containing protein [Rathayibacter sp. VKM Ac-2759]|uniref:DUF1905 domain-containing protein n=1 Tax=Rathayibacter sp. VKM Ac-2759 TaxID=2609252 RepID=UPI001316F7D9|nr:DUF1905 domain-containing protein [Rathayibacter sp. VKM Ac-2759]QHC65951.1 DUF1905 domain-containing protein [Rathayibacter sp. VKM Ac-2759]